jgi:uncharacterized RDD family membrane protein YckC
MTGPGDPSTEQPAAPPPASPPPASASSAGWSAPAPQPAVAGPAGYFYADVPNRAIAYIIDAIILGIIGFIVTAILGGIGLSAVTANPNPTSLNDLVQYNFVASLIIAVITTGINGAYFVYTWTTMRGSPGMKVLGMQVGNAADGATLTQEQAIRRWIALGAPFGIASALVGAPALGALIVLAAFVYTIALLVTTAQSPTKQGIHDKFANTVVVKAARSVA